MLNAISYKIYSLGDAGITLDLGNVIDQKLNRKVLAMHEWLQKETFPGICEIVVGYSSITILYDAFLVSQKNKVRTSVFDFVKNKLESAFNGSSEEVDASHTKVTVPVCYEDEFAHDLQFVSETTGMTPQEIVRIHTSKEYYVFMIGFIPGFAYMGELDEQIQVPRKERPEMVSAGSVGIASGQTGIYPLESPGGWHIIGRTPLKLFDKDSKRPVLFSPGQHVQFQPITRKGFEQWQSPS
ncbi:MAG TPA: 5-oxoprolinase subunit PxpB [Chitinophagaceae bacterium]|nr:5-oxoprolinase subunit PxpB [Chitinophagaceae bacterium]